MPECPFDSLQTFSSAAGPVGRFHSLPQLEKSGVGPISRLPHSIRIVLESVLRNCDGRKITPEHVRQVANWFPNADRSNEIPFVVARVNYTRFSKATSFDFDETLDKIIASAQKFNADRIKQEDVAKAGGGPPDEE